MSSIRVRGARTHNLKNISLDLPRDRLTVITGLSGSGKSSLAFDTLYAEGQRRYVESLSAYARQFLSIMDKPDADSIEGLSPAIAIEQKSTSHNPRSTVGTVTEIYDYLRLLYARAGTPRCPLHMTDLTAQTVSQMVDQALAQPHGAAVALLAPLVSDRKGEHADTFAMLRAQGFTRARIDGTIRELEGAVELDPKKKHTIEAVVDRLRIKPDAGQRLAESFETALRLSDGLARLSFLDLSDKQELLFSSRHACPICGYSMPALEPKLFSFNNPAGACATCDGLGVQQFFDPARVVRHPHLSLAGGAIRGWDRRNTLYFQLIQALARRYKFDIETTWSELPDEIQSVVLNGTGDVALSVPGGKRRPFEGILPNLERRYRETESPAVRDELAKFLGWRACATCGGARLNEPARFVFVDDRSLPDTVRMTVLELHELFASMRLEGWRSEIATKIVREVGHRLKFLIDVGLDYVTLDRSADTLSGGEAQRIRLASQVGSGLSGVMYVLDEPSIGLHQRDNARLLGTLISLRDLGNTLIVVEHDADAIQAADFVVDLGPGAGIHGGEIIAQGTPTEIAANPQSLTGQYLSGRLTIPMPTKLAAPRPGEEIRIVGASGHNLKNIDVTIPLGLITCVTGVSGSGKSTLIVDTLFAHAVAAVNGSTLDASPCKRIEGLEKVDRVIDVDQSPIGRTPRSNPATYTGLFAPLRELYAAVPESRARGYDAGRFSFNVKGGRCEACQGDGVIKVEMHFLPDVYVPCDVCKGKRYNRETLEIRYRGKTIRDALEMTVEEAVKFFAHVPGLSVRLQTLDDVGLSYLRLGQNATTLSGGEAQRVKLARELAKRATGRTLYILDEPTTGLHFHDIAQLLEVLRRLRDEGNTIVIIEHHLDVIRTADWVIDLGPDGGARGGQLIGADPPRRLAEVPGSYTGAYLSEIFANANGSQLS